MRTQKMKNRIIVCFMTMLGLASCSDTDKESDGYTPLDKQAATSDNLIAALMDGLRDKWSVGDTILLLHDGHTAFAEARNAGNISAFQAKWKVRLLKTVFCSVSVLRAVWYLPAMGI